LTHLNIVKRYELTYHAHSLIIYYLRKLMDKGTLHYRHTYGFRQTSLYNVLNVYTLYREDIGYCQGMNFLAAVLLFHLEEEVR
jgi:hypothetical protein